MFLGLTIEKLLLFGLIAAFVIGPERLPRYAESLANFTKRAREWVRTARTRMRDEMGDGFEDVDWRTLDPRQYDPRRIIREALLDEAPVAPARPSIATPAVATAPVVAADAEASTTTDAALPKGEKPPYDAEAT